MPNLHELASFYRSLEAEAITNDGEFTEDMLARLAAYDDDFDNKVDACRTIMREHEAEAAKFKREAQEAGDVGRAYQASADRLEKWIISGMQSAGKMVAGRRLPLRLVDNSQAKYEWSSDEPIPEAFRKITVELDTKAVDAYYRSTRGSLPSGVTRTRGQHLRVAGIQRKGKVNASQDS
jgi:hypothetical protein